MQQQTFVQVRRQIVVAHQPDVVVRRGHGKGAAAAAWSVGAIAVDEPRLYHARGFFYHAIGCNKLFTGEGCSPDGIPECLTPNMAIADIPGAMLMDLEVTHLDISTLGGFSNSDAIDDS